MNEPIDVVNLVNTMKDDEPREVGKGLRGAIIGTMNKHLTDAGRRAVMLILFGVETSKEMTDTDWHALREWVGLSEAGGYWLPRPTWKVEALQLIKDFGSPQMQEALRQGGVISKVIRPYTFDE